MPKVRGRNLNAVLEMRKARRLRRLRAVLFGVVVLTVIAWIIATYERRQFVRAIDERRVVIMPLENRTGDALLDPLGAVASDWATHLLTFFGQHVDVVPTTTTLDYYRSSNLVIHDPQERAQLLAVGVRAQRVAWGTFYQLGDSLRFDVNVSDIVGDAPTRSVARVAVPLTEAKHGVDVVAKRIARSILDV